MPKNDISYINAAEQVMLHNGYFAPLKLVYKEIWKYKERTGGRTVENTIREKIQRDKKRFTKIGVGVYALTEHLDKLPKQLEPKGAAEKKERKHAEIQGMLLEIGNSRSEVEDTYTNDKKWIFNSKTLGGLATLQTLPPFTYREIIKTVRFADVIWFNERNFPRAIFEVEHSTNFQGAFIKFMELQDFTTEFYCVSPEGRHDKFKRERDKAAFKAIANRLQFLTYEEVESDYQKTLSKNHIL